MDLADSLAPSTAYWPQLHMYEVDGYDGLRIIILVSEVCTCGNLCGLCRPLWT